MKRLMLTLMACFLLSLSGCSSRSEPSVVYQVEKLYIPLSSLELACSVTSPYLDKGETQISPRSLGYANKMNTGCLEAYIVLVKSIKKKYTREGTQDVGK